ncbi:MAG: ChaN family lipoprotein, partial [Bacteroidota bacterium]
DTNTQRELSLSALIDLMEDVDVLFFGEEHNDSIAHLLQDKIYEQLLRQYGEVALSLEMFETDNQQVIDEYLAGYITESKLVNDARAWQNYPTDYRPMLERAKLLRQAVIAANAPRRYVNMVSRKGLDELRKLPRDSRAYLPPLPIFTEDIAYRQRFFELMGGVHADTGSARFFHAQCTWDATMAYEIYKHWKKHKRGKIFHLNGRFHTDYQQGIMTQLQRYKQKIRMKNISCFRVADWSELDWKEHEALGDILIVSEQ